MVLSCKKPCKKKKSTMLTVEQMVDIALGTPEIGAVNFNVLHALLHVVVQQLNIQKCLVEFKGYDSERMEGIILSAKPGPILKLSEYMIDTGDGKPCSAGSTKTAKRSLEDVTETEHPSGKKAPCVCSGDKTKTKTPEEQAKSDKGKEPAEEDAKKKPEAKKAKIEIPAEECEEVESEPPKKVREVDTKKKCPCKIPKPEDPNVCADESLKATPSSYYGSDNEGTCQTIVRVEPVGERCDSWRSRPALAHESMVKLEEKVAMLQDAFEALEQLPTNEELKKRTQGTGCPTTPVKDLWQIYNLNKRVEGCEGTIEKLASMIEDLVKETCNLKEAMLVIADAVDDMECADQMAKTTCCNVVQGQTNNPFQYPPQKNIQAVFTAIPKTNEGQATVTFSKCKDQPCPDEKEESKASKNETSASHPEQGATETAEGSPEKRDKNEGGNTDQATDLLAPDQAVGSPSQQVGIGPEFYKMSGAQKFCVLKEHLNCLICQFKKMSDSLPVNQIASKLCALVSLQRQLDALEKEWRAFLDSFGEGGIMGLHNTVEGMKEEIGNLQALLAKLLSDKNDMELQIKHILHEIEQLRKVKADFEVVEDMLAEKADASVVNRKVSHDQFDAACDDLTRGLDETLDRLTQQEAMWNEAMEELHRNVENKLDKNELMPLKEFINKKLKCLQEKLKQLAQLRKDAEAAGAKSRILRNLNCIACDGDVVMKMDHVSNSQCPPLPPSKNLKPILTFELDQVRKAMKKGPCRAPPTTVEEVVADVPRKAAGLPLTQRDAVENKISKLAHFCNRYCGGSHTITTPQQRVTRIGHFLTEFGPQAMAMFSQENYDSKLICPSESLPPPEIDLQKPCV